MTIHGRWLSYQVLQFLCIISEKMIINLSSSQKITHFPKKHWLNWSSDEGDIIDLESVIFSELLRWRNNCSANMSFESVQIEISNTWEDAEQSFCFQTQDIIKILSYIDRVMSILNLEQHSERVLFGDVSSHPDLVGTCFTFTSFSIVASSLGCLETFLPTPTYVGTCYFINN